MSDKPAPLPAPPPPPPSRPSLADYFILLIGFSLSIYLARLGPLPVEARDFVADPRLRLAVASLLSDFMRLPEGVILLGPFFLASQWVRGRRQGLTAVEWLWVLSWPGVFVMTGLTAWRAVTGWPDALEPYLAMVPALWYAILATTMAALALAFRLLALFSRRPAPWTHSLGTALLLWSGLLAAAVLAVGRFKP